MIGKSFFPNEATGKASDLRAYWQLSFYILPILILGIMALPTKGMTHDIELRFLLITVIFISDF